MGVQIRVPFITAVSLAVALILLGCVCTGQPSMSLDDALALYYENKLEQALPLLQEVVSQHKNDAEAHAWLAETHRRLGNKVEAVETAGQAIALEPCHSFAHTVMAAACHPVPVGSNLWDSDTTWIHILRAIECDSTDGNAWVLLCNDTAVRGKHGLMRKAAGKLIDTGFLTDAVLAFGRWLLRTLPENAILITNGDMDTYPVMALQEAEGLRPDVAVVEKHWLGLKPYLSYLRDQYRVPLPLTDDRIDSLYAAMPFPENMLFVSGLVFNGWLEMKAANSLVRPIALACTVSEDFYEAVGDQFRYTGPFLLWQQGPVDEIPDTSGLRASLRGIRPEDFVGPWVSEQDRSPIRRLYTKYGAKNITRSALVFSEELIEAKKAAEAMKILNWAEEFERRTELGPVFTEEIARLKKRVGEEDQ